MRITSKQYAETLYAMTEGKPKTEIEKSVADFARYLNKSRKIKLAEKIINQFNDIYNKKNGIIEAEIITREKADESLEHKAKIFLKNKYSAKEVVLRNIIDVNIKGGIIMKVGDEVIDGSIAGRLGELKKILAK
ncbi:MAG: F0F1 ATP synthase subunit delta [Parcubacteria group bacterium]|jgi:F-type H+-transporting ATPase subunit delta